MDSEVYKPVKHGMIYGVIRSWYMSEKKELIRDLTTGSVPKTLLSFAMPLFFSGLLQTVYNMVDMIVVGRFVGSGGLAAVSIGGDLLMLLTFIAMGFSNAGQILISRYVGEGRRDRYDA